MSTQTTHIHTEIADTPRRRPAWAPLADLFLNALFPDRDGDVMASERSFVEGIARAAKKSGACEEPTVYDGKTSRTVEEIDACDQDITDDKTIATFAVPDLLQLFRALRLAATLRTAEDAVALLAPRAVTILEIDIDTCSDLQDELPKLLWRCQRALDIDVETDFEYRPRIVTPPRSSESRVEMRRFAGDVRDHLSKPAPLIVLRDRGYRLPDALVRALPSPVVLAPLDRDIVLEALVWSHAPMDAATRAKVLDALPFDDHLARVDSLDLLMAFRADDPVGVAHRLAAFVTVPAPSDGPDLNDIIGYGEAEAVARGMLSDLQAWERGEIDWSDVERSVLLHGAPGTGKSFLARAMAGEAGINLVRGSFAQWQSRGHLGDMLRAMIATFDEARAAAPCVLILDEVDAVGDRAMNSGKSQSYHVQVVNAFLECMDGLADRPGVLVVGTCNFPHDIDKAVLRPGRFDRLVAVPPPGRIAIERMLRKALPKVDADDLSRLIRAAAGKTAAEIDGAIRAAKAGARRAREALSAGHLLEQLSEGRDIPKDLIWRIAIHEAGHAIVAHALRLGRITRISLAGEGGEIVLNEAPSRRLLSDYENRMDYHLAGRAAEIVTLGDASAGSGGKANSDLAKATETARWIDERLGLGAGGLVWRATPNAFANDENIRKRLEAAEERAKNLLASRSAQITRLAERLVREGQLEGAEIAEILDGGTPANEPEALDTAKADEVMDLR